MPKTQGVVRAVTEIDFTAMLEEARKVYPIEKVGLEPFLFSDIHSTISASKEKLRLSDLLDFYRDKPNNISVIAQKAKVFSLYLPHLNLSYLHWLLDSVGAEFDFEKFVLTHFQLIAVSEVVLQQKFALSIKSPSLQKAFKTALIQSLTDRLLLGFNTSESKAKWKKSLRQVFKQTQTLAQGYSFSPQSKGRPLEESVVWQVSQSLAALLNPAAPSPQVYVRLLAIADCFSEKMQLSQWF